VTVSWISSVGVNALLKSTTLMASPRGFHPRGRADASGIPSVAELAARQFDEGVDGSERMTLI
jgi:hypothetical protein